LRPGQNLCWSQIRGQNWGQANVEARPGQWGQARFYSMPLTIPPRWCVCRFINQLWLLQISGSELECCTEQPLWAGVVRGRSGCESWYWVSEMDNPINFHCHVIKPWHIVTWIHLTQDLKLCEWYEQRFDSGS
jgi:hypothetical protein